MAIFSHCLLQVRQIKEIYDIDAEPIATSDMSDIENLVTLCQQLHVAMHVVCKRLC